jgi:D-alanyl-D-alanine carboxypeptidase
MDKSYADKVGHALEDLGIASARIAARGLPLRVEATNLVSAGEDMLGRERFLTPETAAAWEKMRTAAEAEGVMLLLVSAFRSLDYQVGIFKRKLEKGQTIDQILNVNLPPGYSEHHTGRAIDIAAPGAPPLTEEFDQTLAFRWLQTHAQKFQFKMTYPRGNPHGVIYEPWHWVHEESHK